MTRPPPSVRRLAAAAVGLGLGAGCPAPAPADRVVVVVAGAPAWVTPLAESFDYVPGLAADVVEDGADVPRGALVLRLAADAGLGCVECYALSGDALAYEGAAADLLGAQYAVTALLEAHGVRFFHPDRPVVPAALRPLTEVEAQAEGLDGALVVPAVADRILHLHTLHPIEGYFALWDAGADVAAARRVVDWIVRQRGDGLQYPGLSDVLAGGAAALLWRAHTAEVLEYAQGRGLTVGLGVQLFAGANLQLALDLAPSAAPEVELRAEMEERLAVVLDGLPFDRLSLSFGEFFSSDPQDFLLGARVAVETARSFQPDVRVAAVIHVGEDLVVEWEGEELLYYFLVLHTEPPLLPSVHSVMYYDLFEDAGGAYGHDEFTEHRTLLLQRLADGQPVGYFPETAYWVAFDISVPTWLPLYVRSRWVDLDGIARAPGGLAGLAEHAIFSSGWEWGYWQNDYAAMRAAHTLPADWRALFQGMFAPWGDAGASFADAIARTVDTQHGALLLGRLAPYLAGRDGTMDAGEALGIVSQPPRVRWEAQRALTGAEAAAFDAAVVDPMAAFAAGLAADADAIAEAAAPLLCDAAVAPFAREVVDGAAANAARAAQMAALLGAVRADRVGDVAARGAFLASADAAWDAGRSAVARRHAALHARDPGPLTLPADNATIYDYGYLLRADELCFWERDLAQVRNLLEASDRPVPRCAL